MYWLAGVAGLIAALAFGVFWLMSSLVSGPAPEEVIPGFLMILGVMVTIVAIVVSAFFALVCAGALAVGVGTRLGARVHTLLLGNDPLNLPE